LFASKKEIDMPLAWAAGAMAVGSIYSANKASKASQAQTQASNNATAKAGNMAAEQLALDRETLNFYKQQYADQKPMLAAQAKSAAEVSTAQLASMKQNDAISKDYYDYQTGTFRPMEKSIVADAQNYDTAERRDAAAGTAVADVGVQSALAQQSQNRDMMRMGVNPNSTKFAATNNQMSLGEASAKAAAAGAARDKIETQGFARKMDAASLGRNLASSQATSAGVALSAGNSAVTNSTTPITTMNSVTQTMGQGYGMASNGMQAAHNLLSNANSNHVASLGNHATMWGNAATGMASATGTMAGTYFGAKKKN
jgi:hypothetical protein